MEQAKKSHLTRERIIQVAARLFLEKGFEKTSMRDIVEASGMSKGAIYHQFDSKDEILIAVYQKQEEMFQKQMKSMQNKIQGKSGREKICKVIEESLHREMEATQNGAVMDYMKSAEYVLKYMRVNVEQNAPIIAQMIEEGRQDGSIQCDYPEEMAEIFLLLFNIWCDPGIFPAKKEKVLRKIGFLQNMMKILGADVIEDEIVKKLEEMVES